MGSHFIPIGMTIVPFPSQKTQKITSVGEDMEKSEPLGSAGIQNSVTAVEESVVVPQKLKHGVSYNPAVLF